MHETTKLNIEKMNENYIIVGSTCRKKVKFEPGDLVWVHLRKDWFLELRKSKLMPRATSPFKVLEKIKIIHINMSCLQILGSVPYLIFHIYVLIWEKKMRCYRGQLQFKRGRMTRTSLQTI
jgi:hypothetical protein